MNKEIRSEYHLKLDEVYVTNESLLQYKYNKYSLPQEYIEKHLITYNKFNIKEEHELYYKKQISR